MKPIPKIKRYESKQYLEFVRSLPCCVCKNTEVDAHHFKTVGSGGSDLDTVNLCRACHAQVHQAGPFTFQPGHDISFYEVQCKILKTYVKLLQNSLYGRQQWGDHVHNNQKY